MSTWRAVANFVRWKARNRYSQKARWSQNDHPGCAARNSLFSKGLRSSQCARSPYIWSGTQRSAAASRSLFCPPIWNSRHIRPPGLPKSTLKVRPVGDCVLPLTMSRAKRVCGAAAHEGEFVLRLCYEQRVRASWMLKPWCHRATHAKSTNKGSQHVCESVGRR